MAWEIISEESKGPRRQSRLWFRDDALKVLMNKLGSKLLYRHKFREVNNSTVHVNFAISLLVLILLFLITREQRKYNAWC